MEREIRKLVLANGAVPFDEWFESLRDIKSQAAVDSRSRKFGPEISVTTNLSVTVCLNCESISAAGFEFTSQCTERKSSCFWAAAIKARRSAISSVRSNFGNDTNLYETQELSR